MEKEGGNENITAERSLPWLQDTKEEDVWTQWDAEYRDVYVVDKENKLKAVYNLSLYSLSEEANYQDLYDLILQYSPE